MADGSCCTTDGMLTDEGDGMIGVFTVMAAAATGTTAIGSEFTDGWDGICISFKIRSLPSRLLQ